MLRKNKGTGRGRAILVDFDLATDREIERRRRAAGLARASYIRTIVLGAIGSAPVSAPSEPVRKAS